jgi:hypothetical protein
LWTDENGWHVSFGAEHRLHNLLLHRIIHSGLCPELVKTGLIHFRTVPEIIEIGLIHFRTVPRNCENWTDPLQDCAQKL